VNLYKLEVFKDAVKEPLNVQLSNLLKVGEKPLLYSDFLAVVSSLLD